MLKRLIASGRDMSPETREIAAALEAEAQRSFERQCSLEGKLWADPQESTKRARERIGKWPGPILQVHARLAGSITSRTMFPYMFTGDPQLKLEAFDYIWLGKWAPAYNAFCGHRPSYATEEQLTFLPLPSNSSFNGWHALAGRFSSSGHPLRAAPGHRGRPAGRVDDHRVRAVASAFAQPRTGADL